MTSHKKMTVSESLMCGAGHTLDREASAQYNSKQDHENEKDGLEGGRAVEAYEEKGRLRGRQKSVV